MPIDPRAKRLLDMMTLQGGARVPLTIATRREGFAKLMQMGARRPDVARIDDIAVAGDTDLIPVRIYDSVARRTSPSPALVFFHGGGLVAGNIETHDTICRHLALQLPGPVMSVGYRLAPEAPYPAAFLDAVAAFNAIARDAGSLGIDSRRIAIGGESAGCLLATAITHGERSPVTRPVAQLLLCPVVDLSGSFASRGAFGDGYLVDRATLAHDVAHVFPDWPEGMSLPSPLRFGSAAIAPPSVIVSAECDPFRDEAQAYADHLSRHGVPVRHTCHAGMVHSFYGLPALLPQAAPALADAAKSLRELMT